MAACTDSSTLETQMRRHAAEQLGVPGESLRITERTDLGYGQHVFLRATTRETPSRDLTVALDRSQDAGVLGFEDLTRAHDVINTMDVVGPVRVAGWFGALGGQGICGEPFDNDVTASRHEGEGAGMRISYRWMAPAGMRRCVLDLREDGTVERVDAEAVPIADAR